MPDSSAATLTWPQLLGNLMSGAAVPPAHIAWAMAEILSGNATSAQIAAFVTALRTRGETADDVSALVSTMVDRSLKVPHEFPVVLDVVGTGGDGSHSVNISTMAAVVAAACGATVIKHGNRAASSSTGTADVLEQLGIAVDLDPAAVAACATEVGIAFAFAPVFHPAMRHAAPTRKELGVPTVFNILGPLTNPARANAALIGCAPERFAPIMARVLADRGVSALVVRGIADGLDEISLVGPTQIWEAHGNGVHEVVIDPSDFGIDRIHPDDIRGGTPDVNASLVRAAFDPAANDSVSIAGTSIAGTSIAGTARLQAIRDAVALNAAAALVAYERAQGDHSKSDLRGEIAEALPRAKDALVTGAASTILDRWAEVSTRLRATTHSAG